MVNIAFLASNTTDPHGAIGPSSLLPSPSNHHALQPAPAEALLRLQPSDGRVPAELQSDLQFNERSKERPVLRKGAKEVPVYRPYMFKTTSCTRTTSSSPWRREDPSGVTGFFKEDIARGSVPSRSRWATWRSDVEISCASGHPGEDHILRRGGHYGENICWQPSLP